MKNTFLAALFFTLSVPSMTNADEKEVNSREIASMSVKTELNIIQEKRKKELNEKIQKIILSEVNFKN